MDAFEQTVYWLLSGSKGSLNRIKILNVLQAHPLNLNELSQKVGLNYKTTQHHVELLVENNLIVGRGNKYGQVYFVSEKLLEKKELFNQLTNQALGGGKADAKE